MTQPEKNLGDDNPSIPIFDKSAEQEAAFWRLKRASDEWRENRVKRVLAQEGESLLTTLGRVLYISSCILFDGLVLIQIPVNMGKTSLSWVIFVIILVPVINFQREYYDRWFSVDITQIDFDQE